MSSLWGDDFNVRTVEEKKIVEKAKKPKKATVVTTEKKLKSKKITIDEKLRIIKDNVYKTLGVYVNDTLVIKDRKTLTEYIDKAIQNGVIAIDTETNRSLDYLTCKLMGPCLYTPGLKAAYVPTNHVDLNTGERLNWQLTEEELKEEFSRLDGKVKVITHNGKFDYQVLRFTTGWNMDIYWDTMIGARLLNENERAGLKEQYITKIDPSIEKYSIEHLFDIDYEIVDPDLFALYAATDSMMTYKLYLYQKEIFERPEHEKLYDLFMNVEMPIVTISADMEATGICLDLDYCKRLQDKYHGLLDELNVKLGNELNNLKPQIDKWRLTAEANNKVDNKKSKNEQLNDPPVLTSPTQLAILFYDVLKVPVIDKSNPRGTGKDILEKIDLPIAKMLLEFKAFEKLVTAFIDVLPDLLSPRDGRLHSHFNQTGTDTGRFSCIAGGTMISSPSGDKPIEDVKVGDWVYCYTNDNKLTLSKVKNVYYNGERECVKLDWISKYNHSLSGSLICTPDHFVKTGDGWVMAKDLKETHSIPYVHRRVDDKNIALYGYMGQGNEEEHAWIKSEFLKADSNYDVHHIDFNHLNNNPDNLTVVDRKTHVNLHLSDSNGRMCGKLNYTESSLLELGDSVNWELTKCKGDFATLIKWMQSFKINYILKFTQSYSKRDYEIRPNNKARKATHLPLNESNLRYAIELASGDLVVAAGYFGVSLTEFRCACDKYELLSNHNVIGITKLDGLYKVYDLEVEDYHNFIANELCVHNCTEPDLQQMLAKNKEIRMMFKASDGYMLTGSDFSAQEPRLFSAYSMDDSMLDAFKHDRDVYATLGKGVYKCDYWDCMEHHEDGTPNPTGKKKRKAMKALYLGITYGMGVPSIAERLGLSIQEAQKVLDDFYNGFPKAKKWIDETQAFAHKFGYVEDFWGRRRRLPDIQLPRIEVKYSKFGDMTFNPILGSLNKFNNEDTAEINKYKVLANACKTRKELENLKYKAEKDGVYIKDNSGFIATAERQCVNARVQGGAATMSKKAMINLYNDEELKRYGFRMLICVHDEIIGECKEEYVKECSERLSYIMSNCVPEIPVNFKCDPTIEYHWNEEDYCVMIKDEFEKLVEGGSSKEQAIEKIVKDHTESLPEKLVEYIEQ